MASNQITVNFTECTPAPLNGYNIIYRIAGSSDIFRYAGNFTESPAVIVDTADAAGTQYEGFIRADAGELLCNDVPFNTTPVGSGFACGSLLGGTDLWTTTAYHNYGYYYLDTITGSPATINLTWNSYDRPNRFTLIDETDNVTVETTGWVGNAAYVGPWGASLATAETGVITFNPVAGHVYKLQVEAGNSDGIIGNDSWDVTISCE